MNWFRKSKYNNTLHKATYIPTSKQTHTLSQSPTPNELFPPNHHPNLTSSTNLHTLVHLPREVKGPLARPFTIVFPLLLQRVTKHTGKLPFLQTPIKRQQSTLLVSARRLATIETGSRRRSTLLLLEMHATREICTPKAFRCRLLRRCSPPGDQAMSGVN